MLYVGTPLSVVRAIAGCKVIVFDPETDLKAITSKLTVPESSRIDIQAVKDQRSNLISVYGSHIPSQLEAIQTLGVNVVAMPWTYRIHDSFLQMPYPRAIMYVRHLDSEYGAEDVEVRIRGRDYRLLRDLNVNPSSFKSDPRCVIPLAYEQGPVIDKNTPKKGCVIMYGDLPLLSEFMLSLVVKEGLVVIGRDKKPNILSEINDRLSGLLKPSDVDVSVQFSRKLYAKAFSEEHLNKTFLVRQGSEFHLKCLRANVSFQTL